MFVLPDLCLEFDGTTFEVIGDQLCCDNPKLCFWLVGTETLSRSAAESVLSIFVERVIDKFAREDVTNSEFALCWSRVSESRADPASQVSRGGASVSNWPRAQPWWASSASSSATMGPVSTTTVGDATLLVLGDSLVEQSPVRRQIGTSAADSADEVPGQPGTAR